MDREESLELLKQAVALAKSGQKAEARTLLLNAISQDPMNEMAWLWLASVAEASQEARASLEQALVLNPTHEAAAAWLERLEDEVQGEEVSERAAESTPLPGSEGSGRDAQSFALGYLDLERMEEAVSYLQAAAELQPENPRLGKLVAGLKERLKAAAIGRASEPSLSLGGDPTASSLPSGGPASGVGRTVLVADGDLGVRQLVARVLGEEQWGVLPTSDGLEAVSCLQQTIPDLILVATDLRQVAGERICQLVKSNDLTCDIPVVLLAAAGSEERAGHDMGADLILGKPLDASLLRQMLWRFFGSHEGTQP